MRRVSLVSFPFFVCFVYFVQRIRTTDRQIPGCVPGSCVRKRRNKRNEDEADRTDSALKGDQGGWGRQASVYMFALRALQNGSLNTHNLRTYFGVNQNLHNPNMMFNLTKPRLHAIVAPVLLLLGTAGPASAELTPDQIAIIVNENSLDSVAVANHYAARRGVPKTHIIRLNLSTKETISRDAYESTLRIPTMQILEKRGLADKIRVLITTYGVPLRVNAPQPTDQEQRWTQHALTLQTQAMTHLQSLDRQLALLVPASGERKPPPETIAGLIAYVSQEIQKTASTLKGMSEDSITETSLKELFRISVEFGGIATFAKRTQLLASADAHSAAQDLQKLRQQITTAHGVPL